VSVRNDNLRTVFAGWVDALRRDDLETIERHLHPDAVWQGLRPDLVCGNRAAIIDNVRQDQGWLPDVGGLELSADGDQVLFGVHSPDLVDVAGEQLEERVFQVFTLAEGLITRIDEYRARDEAVAAMQERREALETAPADPPRSPPAPVDGLIPFVHVADVNRSVRFYELLGFAVEDTYRPGEELDWAYLSHADARIMLARAGEPVRARDQAVLFYLYTPDLPGLQQHLRAHGHRAGAIRDGSPGPAAEMRVTDPDGYVLMIAQRDG
jgi:ketosteroid isomerase-like protein